jgi:predicted lipoprotein with Yx(FWY)xxD motif
MKNSIRNFFGIATLTLGLLPTAESWAQTPTPSATSSPSPTGSPALANQYSYKTSQGSYGEYVSDYQGKAVYALDADTAGSEASTCYTQCAQAWPPVTIPSGQNPVASGSTDQSKFGTIQRTDGTYQVTYNGWPLYYYAADQNPGEYKGQKINDVWGTWYLLKPDGS